MAQIDLNELETEEQHIRNIPADAVGHYELYLYVNRAGRPQWVGDSVDAEIDSSDEGSAPISSTSTTDYQHGVTVRLGPEWQIETTTVDERTLKVEIDIDEGGQAGDTLDLTVTHYFDSNDDAML